MLAIISIVPVTLTQVLYISSTYNRNDGDGKKKHRKQDIRSAP